MEIFLPRWFESTRGHSVFYRKTRDVLPKRRDVSTEMPPFIEKLTAMDIRDILDSSLTADEKITALCEKHLNIPPWRGPSGLINAYDPSLHPVADKAIYRDAVTSEGVQPVTRIMLDFQRLAVRRMAELICGIPVKRVYKPTNDREAEVAAFLESVYERNRIDSLNIERCNLLFSCCEVLTLWYAIEEPNNVYGVHSPYKLRARNFAPSSGDELYPLFDEYGDMIAMSVAYTRRIRGNDVRYFDTYTADRHICWSTSTGGWTEECNEKITLGKIPAVYMYRPTPVWEETSNTVYEMEWALSRNGNYLRRNSKPVFAVFADEQIPFGDSSDKDALSVMQFPKGSAAQYVTWPQAVDNLKFYIEELRSLFFTQLQLPDWSYEKMSQQALSGESRKQMFIDAQLKVKDESGRLIEFFDREMNVIKAFARVILGSGYAEAVDSLAVEQIITPFSIEDEGDTIKNLVAANGGKAIISQRESVELYGHSKDIDKTMAEIAAENAVDVLQPESGF